MYETYTVKRGDTLFGISNQFGVSVTELANLNNKKGDTLQIGEVLKIPNSSGTNPNNMFMYTVKKGDSLYSIAKKYNTTVDKIVSLNYLKTTNLNIGDVLRIPETYTKESEFYLPEFTNYVVKKGDTLYKIARDNNITVNELMKDNSLSNMTLNIGQVLKIRTSTTSLGEIEECFGTDYEIPNNSQTITYKVQKGDSLYSISKRYNTSVDNIVSLNNLKSNNLNIGQILKIPTSSSSSSTVYIVKKGDSLYSIAKKFNTTVSSIKSKNKLTSNNLSINQKLYI